MTNRSFNSSIPLSSEPSRSGFRFRAGLVVLMAGLLAAAIASWAGLPVVEQVLKPDQIGPGAGGHQWADYHVDSPLRASGLFVVACDDNAGDARGTLRSELVLFEDGKALGPGHGFDETIREIGAGTYSYRCLDNGAVRGLIFSTSDNSDPRTNGRQYLVRYPIQMAPALFIATLFLAAILAMVALRGRWLSLWIGSVWFFAIAITAQALSEWFVVPAAAFFVPDSWGYLHPALSAFAGGPFAISSGRSIGYPGFVLAILMCFGSIPAVVYVQAILCLVTAGLVAAIPLATTIGIRMTPAASCLRAYLGAGLLLLFFHYGPMAYSVHAMIPEMLYTTVSAITLLLLIIVFRISAPLWVLVGCGLGLYLTIANFYVKPSWGIAMLFSGGLFALRILFTRKVVPAVRAGVLTVSGLLVLNTLIVNNDRLSNAYDGYSYKIFGPLTLLCHHAPLIIRSIDRRLLDDHANDRMLLDSIKNDLVTIVNLGQGPDHYTILGYDPNRCLYGNIVTIFSEVSSNDPDRIGQLMIRIFWRSVLDDPFSYLAKVAKHALVALYRPLVEINAVVRFDDKSVPSASAMDFAVVTGLFVDHARFVGTAAAPLASDFGLAVLDGLNNTLWIMMLLGGVLLVLDLAWPYAGLKPVIRRWTPAVLASGLLIGAVLVVAISSTVDVTRYRYPLFPLALGMAAILVQTFFEMAQARLTKMPDRVKQAHDRSVGA